jgi:hypothetical protein
MSRGKGRSNRATQRALSIKKPRKYGLRGFGVLCVKTANGCYAFSTLISTIVEFPFSNPLTGNSGKW